MLFFSITIFCTLLTNLSIAYLANKRHPYIKNNTLDKTELHAIKKNVSAMFIHKIGGVVVFATDNLLISKFVSVLAVGLYSNYSIIVTAINSLVGQITSSMTASVGNLEATADAKASYAVFKYVFLFNPFITL